MSVLLIVFLSKMSSFRAIRELSLLCFEEGILSEEEFVLLYQNYHSGNPEFPYDSYSPFCLKEMNEAECLANFRVKKHDLFFLQQTIQIPATIKCPQRTTCPEIEGLCILLNRLIEKFKDPIMSCRFMLRRSSAYTNLLCFAFAFIKRCYSLINYIYSSSLC